jgi:hypothetical protein
VRAFDNTGASLAGVVVTMSLVTPGGATLNGGVAMTDASGVAIFPTLSVNTPGTYQLLASAAGPTSIATAVSNQFTITAPTLTATVLLSNFSAIYDGTAKSVGVTTIPPDLATSVTYNGGSAPTAIGAYNVVASVTAPGYIGGATGVQTVASTPAAGGPGGGAYPPTGALSCGPGVFANGVRAAITGPPNEGFGDINYALTSGQLLCSNGVHPGQFGGTTTPNSDLSCPSGQVMVGIFGTTGGPGFNVVTSVGARCQTPAGGPITQTSTAPGSGTPFGPIDCPTGEAVTGVVGGQGAVVDSIALVCGVIPPAGPTITSASPTTVAAFQYITLYGTSLPATGQNDVRFSQGGPEFPSDYVWSVGTSRVIARVPSGVLTPGPATVRLRNPGDTVTTNAFPITVSNTPGAPVILGVYSACVAGTATTTITPGQQFMIEADGTGSAGTNFTWTQGATTFSHGTAYGTGGPTGNVGSCATAPAGLTSGVWTLTVTSNGGAASAGVAITVP